MPAAFRTVSFTVPPEKRMEPVNMQWEGGQIVGAVGAITGRSYRVESFPGGGAKVHYTDDDMLDPNDPRFVEFDRD